MGQLDVSKLSAAELKALQGQEAAKKAGENSKDIMLFGGQPPAVDSDIDTNQIFGFEKSGQTQTAKKSGGAKDSGDINTIIQNLIDIMNSTNTTTAGEFVNKVTNLMRIYNENTMPALESCVGPLLSQAREKFGEGSEQFARYCEAVNTFNQRCELLDNAMNEMLNLANEFSGCENPEQKLSILSRFNDVKAQAQSFVSDLSSMYMNLCAEVNNGIVIFNQQVGGMNPEQALNVIAFVLGHTLTPSVEDVMPQAERQELVEQLQDIISQLNAQNIPINSNIISQLQNILAQLNNGASLSQLPMILQSLNSYLELAGDSIENRQEIQRIIGEIEALFMNIGAPLDKAALIEKLSILLDELGNTEIDSGLINMIQGIYNLLTNDINEQLQDLLNQLQDLLNNNPQVDIDPVQNDGKVKANMSKKVEAHLVGLEGNQIYIVRTTSENSAQVFDLTGRPIKVINDAEQIQKIFYPPQQ